MSAGMCVCLCVCLQACMCACVCVCVCVQVCVLSLIDSVKSVCTGSGCAMVILHYYAHNSIMDSGLPMTHTHTNMTKHSTLDPK